MSTPTPGQKTIPIKDWTRFLRVADWWDRTFGHQPPGVAGPAYGQTMIIKTPSGGIPARDGTTIYSATCTKCVAAETATPGEKTLHDTEEEVAVCNSHAGDIAGDSYVTTSLSPNGTRYVELNDSSHHWGTLDEDLDTGGTADFTSDSDQAFADVNAPPVMAADKRLEADSAVGITLFSDGLWYVTWAPCPIDQP